MDVYISQKASQELKAAVLLFADKNYLGYLIGHKRGHRYFIESIIPSRFDILLVENIFFSVNELFNDKVIGFFSFSHNENKNTIFFNPLGVGKILVIIHPRGKKVFKLEAFQIDYLNEYKFDPVDISLKEIKV